MIQRKAAAAGDKNQKSIFAASCMSRELLACPLTVPKVEAVPVLTAGVLKMVLLVTL